jgi:hypothetical protein
VYQVGIIKELYYDARPTKSQDTYLGYFFLDPKDIRELSIVAIWTSANGTGLP